AAGRVRAELGPSDNNKSIALRFRDEASSSRLVLGIEEESSLLVLHDKTGRPRVGLVTLAQGAPGFTFYDTTGRARVELGVSRDGEPGIVVRDARGGSAWKAPGGRLRLEVLVEERQAALPGVVGGRLP